MKSQTEGKKELFKLNTLIDLVDSISYLGINYGVSGRKKDDVRLSKAKTKAFKIIDFLIKSYEI